MSTRDVLNAANPNNVIDALRDIGLGELLNALINAMASTETGVSVTANVMTLANQPSVKPFEVEATTGTTLGKKKVFQGPITGPQAIVPAAGQVVWDGGTKILFASVDAITVAKATYAKATDVTASTLQNDVGIRTP